MPDFNSYSLFVQILVSSFHCTMKTPKMHVLFVENIVAGGYLLPSFFLSSIVNRDNHFARLSACSVSKMSLGHFSLQCLLRSVIHSFRARRAHSSLFLCVLWNDTLRSTLQGFSTGRLSKTLRAVTVALALCPCKRLEITIVRVPIFHS